SSEDFADFIKVRQIQSTKNLVFVIGGFLGLSDEIKKRADLLLSFSAMTFTHQMMPILLLEQIYRGYSIIAGSPYHK
ncbi:MAG: 23S rRNA (pseudouridine(1915)-N(3))-methyltransferase RlmH, partial [Tissierellia bacterium]|nr:23S rRNA (pseudouridine(1915)-N(3))-methyltransferase RlmH [Tissierellia bacterium]